MQSISTSGESLLDKITQSYIDISFLKTDPYNSY